MLGARIAALRRKEGMSQAQLAARLQISASAIGMYEQGRREPSADTLVALAREFGVSTDYLLTGRPLDSRDGQAVRTALDQSLRSCQELLSARTDPPLTREELAALLAAVLANP